MAGHQNPVSMQFFTPVKVSEGLGSCGLPGQWALNEGGDEKEFNGLNLPMFHWLLEFLNV